ncbi:hypothetical protein IAR55_005139 [Kwoniella newhampshirensis]|uniref:CRAL-TRIO domain-containing protein n=1 Tax=Kwoniella newhampshirensis TaxID=1651941 RepID=A0AAW0YUX5_9TREE
MSSFFSRSTKSASSSTSSLNKLKGTDEAATNGVAKNHDIFTTPPAEASVKKKWNYDEHQLKQYTKTLMLPESDPYYPWEKRFLADPGTHPRYMRAAKWKMEDAKKRIKGTLEWRREYKPELIEPGDVSIEAESGKIILNGFDLDGRPVLYMRPGRENTEVSPRQIRHLIYHLERALDFMPPGQEQVAIIVDYKSATSQSNPSISTARKVLNILQNHYVERLGRGLVVNMPWWINAFFTGITPFLDPITRDKIRFNPKLTELCPASQLDAEFGGTNNFEFDHKTYWKTLTEFCHIASDGSRVNDKGEKWYPPAGNGIKAALEGLVPAPGAVATGHVIKSGENSPTTDEEKPSSAAEGAAAAVTAGAASAATTEKTEQEHHLQSTAATDEKTGSTGVEEGMKRMSLNRALTTAPGAPEGDVVFDHPPSAGEKAEVRQSLDQ